MHFTAFTALLLPLLLSSVLAVPTPAKHDNANGLKARDGECYGIGSEDSCEVAEQPQEPCDPDINAVNSCYQQQMDESEEIAWANGEDNNGPQ